MTQDRFHSPTRSAASISPLGDQMSDVTTRADDRWARLTLLLWSQREEDWRERVKSGKMVGTIEPSTCSHPTSARQKGANQYARWENCTKCQQRLSTEKRDYWKEAKVPREKASEKEEMARRMEEQKNRAFRSAPRRPRPRARVPTLEQMNDQLRNDQPNKTESGPGPASRTPTVAASSSTNDHLEEVLKGQAQQAEFLQHMWVQQSQMQQALQQQVCALTGAFQQLAETQQVATAWTSEETRRKTSRG